MGLRIQEKSENILFLFLIIFLIPKSSRLILAKLIHHCENLSGQTINSGRRIVNNAFFSVPFEKDGDLIQMEVHADTFITSKKSLQSFEFEGSAEEQELPNLFPIKATITLPTKNIYQSQDIYRKLIFFEKTIPNNL